MGISIEERLTQENRSLREKVEYLEEQILQLKEMLIPTTWQTPKELKLTHFEATILETLYHSETVVSRKKLIDVLYYFRTDGDVPIGNTIEVFVARLRSKTKKFNIEIDTVRSRGYILTPESRTILKEFGYTRTPTVKELVSA